MPSPVRRALTALALVGSFAAATAAQTPGSEVALATGRLRPGPQWTVLRAAELAAATRPNDPQAPLARTMLGAAIDGVRARDRTALHVLLHGAGPNDQLRLVNAYHVPGSMRASALRDPQAIDDLRRATEQRLAAEGTTVTYDGSSHPQLWPVDGLRLRFAVRAEALQWFVDYHTVPAGDAVQFFETLHFADDTAADGEIAALLRTFDGAREPTGAKLLPTILFGAVGGLCAGLALTFWRRKKAADAAGTPGRSR